MNGLGVMVVLATASWVLRAGFVVLVPASRMPAGLRDGLQHLPPAVLAALVAVDLTGSVRASADLCDTAVVLGTAAVLALAAWRTRSIALVSLVALAAVAVTDVAPW
jgi:branched-subunit amino acid transport protein